jgi:hypothetical protein
VGRGTCKETEAIRSRVSDKAQLDKKEEDVEKDRRELEKIRQELEKRERALKDKENDKAKKKVVIQTLI